MRAKWTVQQAYHSRRKTEGPELNLNFVRPMGVIEAEGEEVCAETSQTCKTPTEYLCYGTETCWRIPKN